ncbi:uncharacterized protein Ecym_1338 [Eremothecium cymbalariae DBVPG|uniref:Trimethyllysine dioxygenase n=1 Tax=Eremothecium cymbalariae (strain CBS 270.75 / DBVPG 7215 / KCTC 17166 / NRRL Y-17582) TaxID=931890 RepID=G8JNA8_ERECY|nr:hypothetical protein Ecym_1338 [Eremothecium cymbalariae DBVPG\
MKLQILETSRETSIFERSVTLQLNTGESSSFHWVYLRDNCTCTECFHVQTVQRTINTFAVLPWKVNAQTLETSTVADPKFEISDDNNTLNVRWPDGHVSEFQESWLIKHSYNPPVMGKPLVLCFPPKIHWNSAQFSDWLEGGEHFNTFYGDLERALPKVLLEVYQYGFSFIRGIPPTMEGTRKVSEAISIIQPSHYCADVWEVTSNLYKNDSAYTNVGIDLHSDGNYWKEPPGLQLFHLLAHTDGEGGETRLVDSANILDQLQALAARDESWQVTYQVLTEYKVPFHQSGEKENVFYQDGYPTLNLNSKNELEQCRWNTSDRISQAPKSSKFTVPQIYEAFFRFNSLINDPKNFVKFALTPGVALVIDNVRVLHARTSFTGYRRLSGTYLTRDDYMARLRSSLFKREELLNDLYE